MIACILLVTVRVKNHQRDANQRKEEQRKDAKAQRREAVIFASLRLCVFALNLLSNQSRKTLKVFKPTETRSPAFSRSLRASHFVRKTLMTIPPGVSLRWRAPV